MTRESLEPLEYCLRFPLKQTVENDWFGVLPSFILFCKRPDLLEGCYTLQREATFPLNPRNTHGRYDSHLLIFVEHKIAQA